MLLESYKEIVFENIKHIDENGNEYWEARELQKVLEYKEWRKFSGVIKKAIEACRNSGYNAFDHFVGSDKMVNIGSGAKRNHSLNQVAKNLGVKNFDKFHNAGYKGLYNGESANDIAKRKGLRYREDILDNMGSEELVDNLFRIIHTEEKLKRENIKGENKATIVHHNMGKDIRNFIESQGGTMPEKLPTPKKSLKELEKK